MTSEMIVSMECTCCGKDYPKLEPAKIEGALIDVCERCTKFGARAEF